MYRTLYYFYVYFLRGNYEEITVVVLWKKNGFYVCNHFLIQKKYKEIIKVIYRFILIYK